MPDPTTAGQSEYGDTNPWAIAILVSVATFMEVLDTTIANVALRYISGGLAVSSDEASWVITTYLVANSIVLCASGWIAKMFGRKNFFLVCIALFTVSSLLCGFAWNLQSLLVFRVIQGLAGGGKTPVAQSNLAAAFPPAKRNQGFALYGIAVVVAPVVGPTLGGWLSDNVSWHWCFLINVPVGLISLILIYLVIPSSEQQRKERATLWAKGPNFDVVGFILVAMLIGVLIGCLAGAMNGLLVASGLPAILATLGTMQLFAGLAVVLAYSTGDSGASVTERAGASVDAECAARAAWLRGAGTQPGTFSRPAGVESGP